MLSYAQLSIWICGRSNCDFFWSFWRILWEITFWPLYLSTDVHTYGSSSITIIIRKMLISLFVNVINFSGIQRGQTSQFPKHGSGCGIQNRRYRCSWAEKPSGPQFQIEILRQVQKCAQTVGLQVLDLWSSSWRQNSGKVWAALQKIRRELRIESKFLLQLQWLRMIRLRIS